MLSLRGFLRSRAGSFDGNIERRPQGRVGLKIQEVWDKFWHCGPPPGAGTV